MISIITPAYNAERWIGRAIASVQKQTRTDWELIIVDDGSNDETRRIAEAFRDSRIKVLHQENAGVSAARNTGLDVACGEYVTFLDADDTLPSNALEICASVLDREPATDIVRGVVRLVHDAQEDRLLLPDLQRGPLLERLVQLQEGVFVNPSFMLRFEKIGTHRFQTGLSHCEDLIFFIDLAHDANLHYAGVPSVAYEYRVTVGSAMSNLDGIEAGYLELLRHVGGLKRISEQSRGYLHRRVARILFRSWLRRGKLFRALRSRFLVAQAVKIKDFV
jgi:glycosyltransferase involved in cell wall biosynthesis